MGYGKAQCQLFTDISLNFYFPVQAGQEEYERLRLLSYPNVSFYRIYLREGELRLSHFI